MDLEKCREGICDRILKKGQVFRNFLQRLVSVKTAWTGISLSLRRLVATVEVGLNPGNAITAGTQWDKVTQISGWKSGRRWTAHPHWKLLRSAWKVNEDKYDFYRTLLNWLVRFSHLAAAVWYRNSQGEVLKLPWYYNQHYYIQQREEPECNCCNNLYFVANYHILPFIRKTISFLCKLKHASLSTILC